MNLIHQYIVLPIAILCSHLVSRLAGLTKGYIARYGPFHVLDENTVVVNGAMDAHVYSQLKQLYLEYPNVTYMIMERCPGSLDDEELVKAGILLHEQSVHIHLPSKAKICSGGVDFYLAGTKRTMDKGARLGVHAWDSDENDLCATDFALDHEVHEMYIEYYSRIGWSSKAAERLYIFIINSATPQKTHYITEEEIIAHNITSP